MGWFIMRTKGDRTQFYTNCNVFQIGEWVEAPVLPHIFNKRDALYRLHVEEQNDPTWNYEVNEFLR